MRRCFLFTVVMLVGMSNSTEVLGQLINSADSTLLHSPRKALIQSALVPGWGQIYNGQKIKVPFIYAGLGTAIGFAAYFNSRHTLYDQAYLFKVFENEESGVRYPEFEPDYNEIAQGRNINAETLRQQRNSLRRNRDVSILATIVVYGINLLDAYVGAQLTQFDVGEDLSLVPRVSQDQAIFVFRLTF